MSTEKTAEEFPISQADANRLLEHIAVTLVHYLSAPSLLRVYEGVSNVCEVKPGSGNREVEDFIDSLLSESDEAWEKLLRKPFMAKLLEIMKED